MDRKAQFSLWTTLSKSLQNLLDSKGVQFEQYVENGTGELTRNTHWLSQTSMRWGDILSLAITQTGVPSLALRFGQFLSPEGLGPLGYALVSSPNVSSAINMLIKYWPIISDEVDISLEVSENHNSIVIKSDIPDSTSRRLFIESILSGIVSIGHIAINKGFSGLSLNLDYPEPGYFQEYQKVLGVVCDFSCERCELKIPNELVKQKMDRSNPYVEPFLRYQCELISSNFYSEFKLTRKICWILVKSNSLNMPINILTKKLNMSERTLRRRLLEEKTNYGELRDKIKKALAEDYLKNSDFTIEDISLLLGYSEKSSFIRAFKRWAKVSPYSYRVG